MENSNITKQLIKVTDNKMDNKMIGNRINELLAKNNMLQKELAKQLDVSDNVISYWCCGSRKPSIEQIIQIAKLFNCSTDYLLGVSNVATSDKDIQYICEYTGLDEKAVEKLHNKVYLPDDVEDNFLSRMVYGTDKYRKIMNRIINNILFDYLIEYEKNMELIDEDAYLVLALFYCDLDNFKSGYFLYKNFLIGTEKFVKHFQNNYYNSFLERKELVQFKAQKSLNKYFDDNHTFFNKIYNDNYDFIFWQIIDIVKSAIKEASRYNDEKQAIEVYKKTIKEKVNIAQSDLKSGNLFTENSNKLKSIYDEYFIEHYNLKKKGDSNAE